MKYSFMTSNLIKTTVYELAAYLDEIEFGKFIIFTTEDPKVLTKNNQEPSEYNVVFKEKLLHEMHYSIIVGEMDGTTTIAKDIFILSNGNPDDEDERQDGISNLLTEYCKTYKNNADIMDLYLVIF